MEKQVQIGGAIANLNQNCKNLQILELRAYIHLITHDFILIIIIRI